MKKLFLSVVICLFCTTSALATTFISATVNRVTTTDGSVRVMLNGSNNPECEWEGNRWFYGTMNMDDQVLSIAIAAITSGATVRVGVEACFTEPDVGSTFSSFGLNYIPRRVY